MIAGIQISFKNDVDLSEVLEINNVLYLKNVKEMLIDCTEGSYLLTAKELEELLNKKNAE